MRTAGWAGSARAAGCWLAGDGGVLKIARRIWKVGVVGSPVIGRRRGAFSTLLRRPGLRASSDSVLATKSERKMLARTCLYSLYACLLCSTRRRRRKKTSMTRCHDSTRRRRLSSAFVSSVIISWVSLDRFNSLIIRMIFTAMWLLWCLLYFHCSSLTVPNSDLSPSHLNSTWCQQVSKVHGAFICSGSFPAFPLKTLTVWQWQCCLRTGCHGFYSFAATTTVLQLLYKSTCISQNLQLRTQGFCWSKVLLAACHCWRQLTTFRLGRRRWSCQ